MARFVPLMLLCALAGCGDSVPNVAFKDLCKAENDRKLLATEGNLAAPFEGICRIVEKGQMKATACSYDLRELPNSEARISLNIEQGDGPNRVDKTRQAAKQGVAAIADKDGKFLADKARVRVTGTVAAVPNSLKPDETICWMDVTKIERR
jgi:hypothetical protein